LGNNQTENFSEVKNASGEYMASAVLKMHFSYTISKTDTISRYVTSELYLFKNQDERIVEIKYIDIVSRRSFDSEIKRIENWPFDLSPFRIIEGYEYDNDCILEYMEYTCKPVSFDEITEINQVKWSDIARFRIFVPEQLWSDWHEEKNILSDYEIKIRESYFILFYKNIYYLVQNFGYIRNIARLEIIKEEKNIDQMIDSYKGWGFAEDLKQMIC
jgi:hypothetical protein